MNQVILLGRLVKDIEIKTSENAKVGYIKLAVNRGYKDQEGKQITDFIDVTCFSLTAETVATYAHKGDLIAVKGQLQNSNYEKDGETIYKTSVIAEKIIFLSSKKDNETEKEN